MGSGTQPEGEVVVTELGEHCVSIFSPNGDKIRSFGAHGSVRREFYEPCDVAVDGEGNILVAERKNNRILKLTAEGQFITSAGGGPLQFYNPGGIYLIQS